MHIRISINFTFLSLFEERVINHTVKARKICQNKNLISNCQFVSGLSFLRKVPLRTETGDGAAMLSVRIEIQIL